MFKTNPRRSWLVVVTYDHTLWVWGQGKIEVLKNVVGQYKQVLL